mgnify:FL=1
MAKTSKGLDEAVMTRMQDLGSAWIFKRAIQYNRTWVNWEAIKKDTKTFNLVF